MKVPFRALELLDNGFSRWPVVVWKLPLSCTRVCVHMIDDGYMKRSHSLREIVSVVPLLTLLASLYSFSPLLAQSLRVLNHAGDAFRFATECRSNNCCE
jgi:hypothetical protein